MEFNTPSDDGGSSHHVGSILPTADSSTLTGGCKEGTCSGCPETSTNIGLPWAVDENEEQSGTYQVLSKEEMKRILTRANEWRVTKELQDLYSEKDDPDWNVLVTHNMHRQVLRELGFSATERMLDQVYSARWKYRNDDEMQVFFKDLIHVKYDLTGDGPLQLKEECPDAVLWNLNGERTSLHHFIKEAKAKSLPLAVLAGSWT